MAGLLDPIVINGIRIPNRIVMAAMGGIPSGPNGEVSQRQIEHYVAHAAGVGLVIVGFTYISQRGKISPTQLGINADGLLSGLRNLADAIHRSGAKVVIQIGHGGSRAIKETCGDQPVAPSAIINPGSIRGRQLEMPHALSKEEIREVVEAFGDASCRAIEAGFDGVELHGCHGFLLNQFLSPITNHRDDEYGGDLERRLRFPLEVVTEVRRRLRNSCLIVYRFPVDDLMPGGLTPEQSLSITPKMERAGVDVIDVSGGLSGAGEGLKGQGYFVPAAQSIKGVVGVPVIGIGNITEPRFADKVIREGRVDMVALARALVADAQWPIKAAKELRSA